MNEIFNFQGQQVRTATINGEPYFVGKDVAEILGYQRADNAVRNHVDEDDKLTHQFSASGQNRNMTIINESGLYSLILSSKLPQAKEFKRWVTSEVRKYFIQVEKDFNSPEKIMARALLLADKKVHQL